MKNISLFFFFHDSKDIIDVITYPWSHGIFYTEKAVVLVRLKKQNNSKHLRSVKIKKNRALEKLLFFILSFEQSDFTVSNVSMYTQKKNWRI